MTNCIDPAKAPFIERVNIGQGTSLRNVQYGDWKAESSHVNPEYNNFFVVELFDYF